MVHFLCITYRTALDGMDVIRWHSVVRPGVLVHEFEYLQRATGKTITPTIIIYASGARVLTFVVLLGALWAMENSKYALKVNDRTM